VVRENYRSISRQGVKVRIRLKTRNKVEMNSRGKDMVYKKISGL